MCETDAIKSLSVSKFLEMRMNSIIYNSLRQ